MSDSLPHLLHSRPDVDPCIRRALPELRELLFLAERLQEDARIERLATVTHGDLSFPLTAIHLGPEDPATPVLAFFGGVHGLERIGTQIVTAYLQTLRELIKWDRNTQAMLRTTRILLVPLVNPVGMYLKRRSNGAGIDLMRNAPVEAEGVENWRLYCGHRISPALPWYRGALGGPMAVETQAVCDFVRREIFPARVALSVDVHSGYGSVDRFWFPYAKTRAPLHDLPSIMALKQLLDKTHSNHVYRMEPQSREYLAHGDLWDYLYDEYRAVQPDGRFLPFTLELGSWLWIKKNWSQLFSRLGAFNPWLPHRVKRTLRRHMLLFDFLYRAVHSHEHWTSLNEARMESLHRHGQKLWYER